MPKSLSDLFENVDSFGNDLSCDILSLASNRFYVYHKSNDGTTMQFPNGNVPSLLSELAMRGVLKEYVRTFFFEKTVDNEARERLEDAGFDVLDAVNSGSSNSVWTCGVPYKGRLTIPPCLTAVRRRLKSEGLIISIPFIQDHYENGYIFITSPGISFKGTELELLINCPDGGTLLPRIFCTSRAHKLLWKKLPIALLMKKDGVVFNTNVSDIDTRSYGVAWQRSIMRHRVKSPEKNGDSWMFFIEKGCPPAYVKWLIKKGVTFYTREMSSHLSDKYDNEKHGIGDASSSKNSTLVSPNVNDCETSVVVNAIVAGCEEVDNASFVRVGNTMMTEKPKRGSVEINAVVVKPKSKRRVGRSASSVNSLSPKRVKLTMVVTI